jgi:hypothetical protein
MQCLYVGKASEEAGNHLGFTANSKMHIQGQCLDTWDDGSWACPGLSLQFIQFCNEVRKTFDASMTSKLVIITERKGMREQYLDDGVTNFKNM